ncbi:uncharacterized protein BP01DRAFT_360099 [Aspergillus saccharolyticus JOP 1030-1]|uniref:Uncharacterized protein n=1 Tax=Aspergillus saccharolyticus JOP 1030-1 TaxID=1450539 RepID=A0A318ZAL7_9EURO|nr:hypothetical protein BP01DRAFT_360099 [Aspergillus saccharolyticus JOP 1030-1]PYH41753.1 hypothetical protein BP01DRAFT_360099 [Aspergillus saccharolyticus JOP 1030-1]
MDRLRRSKSARSVRRSHHSSVASDTPDPEMTRQHATTAASLAMLRSKCSYDALGGPGNMAVPSRRHRYTGSQSTAGSSRPLTTTDSSTHDEDYASAALPSINEFQGLDSHGCFPASSYRRLRKSRSMFSTGQRSSRTSHGASSPANDASIARSDQSPRTYRNLRRSMSFLRGEKSAAGPLRHVQSHETAIDLALIQFQQQSAESSPQTEQPCLSVPKTRREHRPFRKTLRSHTSAAGATGSPSGHHGKVRSLSSSIKKGIKRVLGLARPSAGGMEGRGASPSSQHKTQTNSHKPNDSPHTPNTTRHEATSRTQQYPTAGVTESSESLATSRSRVTSWADSTTANTIVTGNLGGRSHLSVIEERAHSEQTLTEIPSYENSPVAARPLRPTGQIDSQRLYSALMRRIGEGRAPETSASIALGHVKAHHIVPTPAASVAVRHHGQTVRKIPSDESIPSTQSFITANAGTVTPQRFSQPLAYCFPESPCSDRNRLSMSGISCDKGTAGPGMNKFIEGLVRRPGTPDQQSPAAVSNSPSVYSRSTGGKSLDAKDIPDEPGTATIYDTQRTTYSSPKHHSQTQADRAPVRPSTDWKQWMHTEIAKIENIKPLQSHYREHAQIYSDEDDFCQGSYGLVEKFDGGVFIDDEMWSNRKISSTSNFSRPFSRSSSARTVVTMQKEQADEPVVPPPPARPPSPCSSHSLLHHDPFHSPVESRRDFASSPMRYISANRFRMPESPTPRRDKAGGFSQKMASATYGRHPARGPTVSRDVRSLHSRSGRGYRDHQRLTKENVKAEEYEIKGQDGSSPNSCSPISSKRMVEMFLESRRRQAGADGTDSGAVGAFI